MIEDYNNLKKILKETISIAVIGASRNESKPSNYVPKYLKEKSYKIIPVNPYASEILGEKCYKNLLEIKERIDLVLVFRPREEIPEIVKIVAERYDKCKDVKYLWLQEGIYSEEKDFKPLLERGIKVIQNKCIMKIHSKLFK